MIKQIFDEIAAEPGTNMKMEILKKYKDNKLLVDVLYMANSKRVKFYIKQIPEYDKSYGFLGRGSHYMTLPQALDSLKKLSSRELTGNAAIQHLKSVLESVIVYDAYIIERIIEKDLKINMGTRNINKVFLNLIEKTGYMGCKPYSKEGVEKLLAKGPAFSQEKMDGRYVNIVVKDHKGLNESRQGEPTILDNPAFMAELEQLDDCVLNAELTMDGVERYESNGIISSLITIANKIAEGKDASKSIKKLEAKHMPYREALDAVRVTAWDILTLEEYATRTCTRPYDERLYQLTHLLQGFSMLSVVETRTITTIEQAMLHFTEIVSRNGEGTVVKSTDGIWADTKPSYQIKIKKELNLDLRITGFNYGTKGTKNEFLISSVDVESEEGLLKTSPTGLSEDEMEYVTGNQDELMGKILEVKCSGVSQDSDGNYSALHPVFKHIRDDKDIANTLEECIEIDKSTSF